MCWRVVVVVLLEALIPHLASPHLITPGKCPDMKVKQNFDIHKYVGTWYGQYSFGTESTQGKGRCVTAIYSYNKTAGLVDIYNWQIPSPGYRSSINGTSVPLDPAKKEGRMKVTFLIAENRTKTFPLLVLDTDYKSWAVVYYCKTLLKHYETSGWVLTRTQDLDSSADKDKIEERVNEVLKRANISRSIYTKTVQNDCTKDLDDSVGRQSIKKREEKMLQAANIVRDGCKQEPEALASVEEEVTETTTTSTSDTTLPYDTTESSETTTLPQETTTMLSNE